MRINVDELTADEITAGQYLAFKEQLVEGEGGWRVRAMAWADGLGIEEGREMHGVRRCQQVIRICTLMG
jgi:hypothetical protein